MSEALAGLPNAQLLGASAGARPARECGGGRATRTPGRGGCSSALSRGGLLLDVRLVSAGAALRRGRCLQADPGGTRGAAASRAPGGRAQRGASSDCGQSARAKAHAGELRGADSGGATSQRGRDPTDPRRSRATARSRCFYETSPRACAAGSGPRSPAACSFTHISASHEPSAPPPAPRQTFPEKGRTEPLGAERYRVQFMADRETHAQLEELRALMRHQIPDGDVGKILARAVAVLHAQVRKRKFAEISRPRSSRPPASPKATPSRHIPAAIRRAVSARDGSRCSYVSSGGRRCDAQEFLEFDHVEAWAFTQAHSIDGITLRCRAHNQQRARHRLREPAHGAISGVPTRSLNWIQIQFCEAFGLPRPYLLGQRSTPQSAS